MTDHESDAMPALYSTLYTLIHEATAAYCVNLDAEHDGGNLRCSLECCRPFVHPLRLTDDDLNRIVLALGPELAVCAKCGKEIR